MYTISINYQTGDSFGSNEEKDEVGCVWETREEAHKALSDIKEHYEAYKSINGWRPKYSEKDLIKEIKNKSWYSKEYWQHCLMIKKSDGTVQQISTFWTGYFERLIEANVVKCSEETDEDRYIPS